MLALVVLGAGTLPATADDPTPTPAVLPPPIPTPTATGPAYVITPGVGGSTLPRPSDPKAVEKARKADQARATKHPAGVPKTTHKPAVPSTKPPPRAVTEVAGPQSPLVTPQVAAPKVGMALRGFAALVAMVVLFEITEVRRYVFRRRRIAVTTG